MKIKNFESIDFDLLGKYKIVTIKCTIWFDNKKISGLGYSKLERDPKSEDLLRAVEEAKKLSYESALAIYQDLIAD